MDRHELGNAFANFDQLVEETIDKLNDEGVGNSPQDPRVVIMFKSTGTFNELNEAEYTSVIYVGGTDAEIAADLTLAPVQN